MSPDASMAHVWLVPAAMRPADCPVNVNSPTADVDGTDGTTSNETTTPATIDSVPRALVVVSPHRTGRE